jgi:FdhD protein
MQRARKVPHAADRSKTKKGKLLAVSIQDPIPKLTVEIEAQRFSKDKLETAVISLARESPYTLFVNDREILSIATLPTHLKELFVGFLVSEGVLVQPEEILECAVDHSARIVRVELDVPEERLEGLQKKGMLTSGCAGGVIFSVEAATTRNQIIRKPLKVYSSTIIQRMKELDRYPGLYSVTRGVHAASLADADRTLVVLEDLGRHNAVDKIVGHCFLHRLKTSDKLLLSTGRITSEVLIKAARSNFPIIVSRSSASSVAIATAKQQQIDVVTYVRAGRFNYFSHGGAELVEG